MLEGGFEDSGFGRAICLGVWQQNIAAQHKRRAVFVGAVAKEDFARAIVGDKGGENLAVCVRVGERCAIIGNGRAEIVAAIERVDDDDVALFGQNALFGQERVVQERLGRFDESRFFGVKNPKRGEMCVENRLAEQISADAHIAASALRISPVQHVLRGGEQARTYLLHGCGSCIDKGC